MRHSIKRISKSALSVILALMMVVSTMAVGITTFNAATISATIYIDCTNQSGYTPNIWVWDDSQNYTGGSWPGKPMTLVSGNIYKYTFDVDDSKVDQVKVIFSFNKRQSSDITLKEAAGSDWATNSKIFTLNSGSSGNYTGTWSTYGGSSGGDTKTFYVAGTTALVNAENEWQSADPSDKMTKNDDGTYSITYTNLDPKSDNTYQFKITNGTWNNTVGYSSDKVTGNDKVTLSSVGDDKNIGIKFNDKSDVTITYNPTAGTVYVSATPVVSDYTINVAARYKSYNNESQGYNDVSSTLPDEIGATYTVNGSLNATVTPGESVTLSASTSKDDKYTFAGWYTDPVCTSQVTLTDSKVTPTANTTYYALYQQNTKNITYNVEPSDLNGAGFTSDSVKTAGVGSEVSVSANAVTGYTSNITATGATISGGKFTVGTSDVTVTATYTVNSHTVTFASLTNGSFDSSTSKTVNYGETVTVVVTPNAGYKVDSVTYGSETATVNYTGDVATATFTMPDSDVEVNATFSKKEYTISSTVNESSMGSMKIEVGGNEKLTFNIGDAIKITPNPNEGYECTSYTVTLGDGTSTNITNGSTYSVTIDAAKIGNITVTATFAAKSYNVTYAGENCTKPANTTKAYNSSVAISGFTASSGYKITGYTVTKTDDSSTTVNVTDDSFTMPAYDVTVTAIVKKQHTVTVTSGENGSVSPTTATVTDVETVELTATPADGYIVDTWSLPTGATLLSGTLNGDKITVSVTADVTINVSFKESQDIVIYLASPTGWSESWSTMSVTQSINGTAATGKKYIVGTSTTDTSIVVCDGGNIASKYVNGSERNVSYIVLPAECANWTSFYIGNASGEYFCSKQFSGAPQYGYCYYNTTNNNGDSCAATTISSPKANNSETESCFVNETVNLTSTVTKANRSSGNVTAGGTDYTVSYLVTDSKNNTTEVSSSWTPTSAGTYTVTAKLTDGYTTFTSADTATVTVKSKTQSAVTASALNASVKITDNSGTDITQAYEGDTVNVTVTPEKGYMCSGTYTVTPNDLSVSHSNNVFTFTMPAQAVNLTIEVVAKELCSVSVTANDSSLGTATRTTSGSIYVGDEFTVTATEANNLGKFISWEVSGAEFKGDSSASSQTATLVATQANVTVTAKFNAYSYFVLKSYGVTITMLPSSLNPNRFISTETINIDDYFKIQRDYDLTSHEYSYAESNGVYWLNADATHTPTWGSNSTISDNQGAYVNKAGAKYVVFDAETGKVSFSDTSDGKQPIKVYAKNGTCTYDNGNFVGTHLNGVTVATAANTTSSVTDTNANTAGYKIYTVTEGSVVKVTTTVNDDYAKEYYVHAFVINGKTYLATAGTGNSYYAEFAVEEGVANYEVTPIYYVNDCKTEDKYITFYVDASEMGGAFDWGNTISSYAYAYTGSGTEANKPDGNYPGQPMLYDEGQGRYYARVPKVMGGKEISGITINNYKNDSVHSSLNTGLTANEQSYDFNDFKKIYDLNYDIIRFDMKPRSGEKNNSELIGSAFNYDTYDSNNGWEAFVDNNGNKVDVLGNPINSSNTNKLYVVSSYQANVSGVGQWSTKWTVYKQDGTKVAEGLPSDFIPRPDPANNTDAYNAIVNGGYTGWEAEITFENRQDLDSALRLDGRWFYAKSSSNVSADVRYRTSKNGTTYTTPVEETSYVTINDAASVTFEKHGETIRVVARPIKGYVFSHWSIADAEYTTFRDLSKTLGSSFTTTLDAETHYVANYIKATDGNLVLSHLKYDGSDAKGGMGYYLIEAEIFDANGVSKGVVKGTGNGANGQSITLTNLSSSDSYIKVTIKTVTSGENTFRYWYTQSSNGFEIIDDLDGIRTANGKVLTDSEDPFGVQGTVTYTFETEVWKLFSGTAQIMSELNFYSDIAPVSKDYTLKYMYKDRFGNDKIYVVKGTHPDSYYVENNNSWAPNEKLIYDNAPAIDDLYKDCTWTMKNCSPDGSSADITANQDGKKYEVTIYNPDDTFNTYTLPINSYVKDKLGKFYAAPATYNNKNFLYWEVKENGVEVARHFYSEYTLVVLGNYEIKPIYGDAAKDAVYISKPQYTREQTTDANGEVKTDRLYVDFMVAYMSSNPDNLIRNDTTGSKYQTGVIVEIGQNKVLGTNDDSSVNTDYSGITYDSNLDTVKSAANNLTGSPTRYSFATGDNRKLYNFRATNTNYNNMNRLDYAVQFVNSDKNQKYVMKAYYYVIVDGKVILSNPVYFNLYEIGNSTPTTVPTTA